MELSFSFIHIADIHLGRPFSDLFGMGDNMMDVCSSACKNALGKIVNLAISKQVDFVLVAGDSFDNDEHDLSTKLQFREALKKLVDNGIKSYVICGNHDPIELYKKYDSYFKFEEKYQGFINITGVTTDDFKHSFSPIDGVNVHTVSFKTDESESLVKELPELNEQIKKDFNIGLIHCDLDKNDSKYSPVSREELRNLGYNYYALGHIHIPEIKEDSVSKIVYAGTPQGRTSKEIGKHGVYFVEVSNGEVSIEFVPVDCVRFNSLDVDCSGFENRLEVYEEIVNMLNEYNTDTELELFYICLTGVTKVYSELDENLTEDYIENFGTSNGDNIKVYKIQNKTIPYVDEKELAQATGVVGILSEIEKNKEIDLDVIYQNICEIHKNIYKKLPVDSESKEFLQTALELNKDNILESVKKEIKVLCNEIYSVE